MHSVVAAASRSVATAQSVDGVVYSLAPFDADVAHSASASASEETESTSALDRVVFAFQVFNVKLISFNNTFPTIFNQNLKVVNDILLQ